MSVHLDYHSVFKVQSPLSAPIIRVKSLSPDSTPTNVSIPTSSVIHRLLPFRGRLAWFLPAEAAPDFLQFCHTRQSTFRFPLLPIYRPSESE